MLARWKKYYGRDVAESGGGVVRRTGIRRVKRWHWSAQRRCTKDRAPLAGNAGARRTPSVHINRDAAVFSLIGWKSSSAGDETLGAKLRSILSATHISAATERVAQCKRPAPRRVEYYETPACSRACLSCMSNGIGGRRTSSRLMRPVMDAPFILPAVAKTM